MTDAVTPQKAHWASLISSAKAAVIIGFASTILVVIEGARAVGANTAQQASVAAVLCFAMAITSFILAVRYRMPIMVAWSTPGAVLIATSASGITWNEAIGAYIVAGALTVLTAVITPLARAIERKRISQVAAGPVGDAGGMVCWVMFEQPDRGI